MLSGILNSNRAIYVNIQIMRTFTQLRHMLLENADLRKAFEELKHVTEDRFQIIFLAFGPVVDCGQQAEKENRIYG